MLYIQRTQSKADVRGRWQSEEPETILARMRGAADTDGCRGVWPSARQARRRGGFRLARGSLTPLIPNREYY